MIAVDQPDIDRVVEELRLDHVVVDPLRGGPEPTETHRRLVAQVAKVKKATGIDVYVALVDDVGGTDSIEAPNAYAARLRKELGGAPGVYVVSGGGTIQQENAWGTPFPGVTLSLITSSAAYEVNARWRDRMGEETGGAGPWVDAEIAVRSVPGALDEDVLSTPPDSEGRYPYALSEADLSDLTSWAVETGRKADWGPDYGADSDRDKAYVRNWLWAVPTFFVLLFGLVPLLRRWPAKQSVRGSVPELADVRLATQRELDALSRELTALAAASARADEDRWAKALSAQDVARTLAESDQVGEVLGAWTLARTGLRDARMARSGREVGYRGCFFDPRHGEAAGERAWQLGQGHVELPACADCLAAGARGQIPEALLVPGRRGARPYFEGSDIWATTGYGSLSQTYAADVLRSRR